MDAGRTWTAQRNSEEDMAVWNHPVGVAFDCVGVAGWPKLFFEVFQTDPYGRVDVVGYGFCFVPSTPGQYSKVIPTSRPKVR